jgi:hypothetical protein
LLVQTQCIMQHTCCRCAAGVAPGRCNTPASQV